MQIISNWNYAGTQKFVSHALTEDGNLTLCGMDVHKLMARRSQQWEEEDSDVCGCVKCNRHLTQREADGCKAGQHLVLSGVNKCLRCGARVNRRQ